MTEAGLANVHGLLQLDGADPVPFCQLRGVQNPLARALQEAYLAIQRARAKPPRMNAPATGSAALTRPHAPPPQLTPAPATTPEPLPRSPAPPSTPSESAAANKRKPVGQPSLF